MITDLLIHLFDPAVTWVAGGLDELPDLDGISWVVQGAGTLDQVVPVSLATGFALSWFGFLAIALTVRSIRLVVAYIPTINGQS